MNTLYYGDNLSIMEKWGLGKIDLIYLDPPFNSKRNYNLMYKNMTGHAVPEQVEAFCDTWELDPEKEARAREMPVLMQRYGVDDYYIKFWDLWLKALRHTQPHLLAYLIYMVERLLHMKSILKPTGSIYLHCDPTASHYIKVMMDGIFGHDNFRNEIIWERDIAGRGAKNTSDQWPRNHDVILMYSRSKTINFTKQKTDISEYQKQFFIYTEAETGRRFRASTLGDYSQKSIEKLEEEGLIYTTSSGKKYKKYYLDEAKSTVGDVWTDIHAYGVNARSKDRLGYPTQKPLPLLERIIQASSNKGDVIFDPFCGCGTTIYAAQKLGREWIGCDIAILPIKLIKHVLAERYDLTEGIQYKIEGIPASVEQAEMLFKQDPHQFQHWVVERIGGFPTQKKSNDKGIDGCIYFEVQKTLKEMVLSVKGGLIRPTDIRDLRGVLEREEGAELAGFISMREPTKSMREEASKAGQYEYNGIKYDRIQFLTVEDIVEEKRTFHTPTQIGVKGATGQMKLAIDYR